MPRPPVLRSRHQRRGAVLPMFVFLLPVLLLLCGLAINVAWIRLSRTELKVATDAAAHAGGRAMSIHQSTDAAIKYARSVAAMNTVGGRPVKLDNAGTIVFGQSTRLASGAGRYSFREVPKASIDAGRERANSVSVRAADALPLLFRGFPKVDRIDLAQLSIATQLDRDIALCLDTSGSMLFFRSEEEWNWVFDDLLKRGLISSSDRNRAVGAFEQTHARSPFTVFPNNNNDNYSPNGGNNSNWYISDNCWKQVVASMSRDARYQRMAEYINDMAWVSNTRAPRHSRWAGLIEGVEAFLDVLEKTDQEELVSLATFDTGARLDYPLQKDYAILRKYVRNRYPTGATAIGQGINASIPSIMTGALARPFAAKTIVVLTDGQNNQAPTPQDATKAMVSKYRIDLHAVTFTPEADQKGMKETAAIGGGKHYHGNVGDDLVYIFEEIANNLPTILTW